MVLVELARIALCDIAGAFDKDGRLLPLHEIPEDVRRAIAGVEVDEIRGDEGTFGVTKKLKFWDKNRALELVAKNKGMLKERIDVNLTGAAGGPVRHEVILPGGVPLSAAAAGVPDPDAHKRGKG